MIVPDFIFTATAEAVVLVGGTPVFVDIQADFNIDVGQRKAGLRVAKDRAETARADRR